MSAEDIYDLAPKREKQERRIGACLSYKLVANLHHKGKLLLKLNIRWADWETFLVVVVVDNKTDKELVAFHTGETLGGALLGFSKKVRRDEVKWRPNKKWEPK